MSVDLDVTGATGTAGGARVSVYRIVQEALTNVVKHAAPAACRVRVGVEDGEVAVDVTDDGQHQRAVPETSGHGIIGMRERAALFGGRLDAQPLLHRGFRVTARLPLAEAV